MIDPGIAGVLVVGQLAEIGIGFSESGALITRFTAYAVFLVTSLTAGLYAAVNARHSTFSRTLWITLSIAAGVGVLFAAVALVETIGLGADLSLGLDQSQLTAFRQLWQLLFVVLLALTVRELYYAAPQRTGETDRFLSLSMARRIEAVFVAVVVLEFLIVILTGFVVVASIVLVMGSVAFTAYGVSFAYGIRTETMAAGTVMDSVLLYTVAVIVCLGAVSAIEGVHLLGLGIPGPAAEGALNVLTIVAATFLAALVVRLKQSADAVRNAPTAG